MRQASRFESKPRRLGFQGRDVLCRCLGLSQAAALGETSVTLLALGDTQGALAAATKAQQVFQDLVKQQPNSVDLPYAMRVSGTTLSPSTLPSMIEAR
jgi:hypothetical protein